MNKKVSNIQMGMLLFLTMSGYFLGMGDVILLKSAKNEVLLSMIIGTFLGLIPLFMYLRINSTYPNLNIYEKNIKLFGKHVGSFINFLILISYVIVLSVSVRTIVSFTISKYLENTPYILVGLLVIASCLIAVFKGLEPILRLARISFVITIAFTLLIESTILGYININNVLPILSSNNYALNIIYGSLYFAASTSLLCILLLTIKKDSIKHNNNYNKTAIIFYFLVCLSLVIVMFFITSLYGYKMASLFRYPEYVALKKIGFSSSELHLENMLAFRWIFYSLALSCVSLFGIKTGIKVYSKRIKLNKALVITLGFVSILISKYALGTVPSAIVIMKKYYVIGMAVPMFILLMVIFIKCIIKKTS